MCAAEKACNVCGIVSTLRQNQRCGQTEGCLGKVEWADPPGEDYRSGAYEVTIDGCDRLYRQLSAKVIVGYCCH